MTDRDYIWQSLRRSFPIRKSEWVASFTLVSIALSMQLYPDMLTRPAYAGMAERAPQFLWQWALYLIGAVRLVVLIINGGWERSPHLRAAAAFLSCFVWWHIAVSMFGIGGIGLAAFAGYFALDALNFKQALEEAGVSEGLRDAERRHAEPEH